MPDNPRFDHLLLSHRKAFVLRWHSACAEPEGELREDEGWDRVERAIAGSARSPAREDDGQRLDHFVVAVLEHRDISDPLACGCLEAVRDLHRRRGQVDCGVCAGRAGAAPCGHDWRLNDAMAADGDCLRPVLDAFRTATALAGELYARSCGAAPPKLRLRMVNQAMAEFAGLRPTVGGQVIWPSAAEAEAGGETVLQMLIDVERFDRNGLKLLPYAAAHEAICHVYQQLAAGVRRQPRIYDSFSEGWMDFVAAELVAGTQGLGVNGELGPGPFGDAEAAARALAFHGKRWDSLSAHRFPNWAKVLQGRLAALAVLTLFRRDDGVPPCRADRGAAWDDFVALSCQLNLSAWTAEARAACLAALPQRVRGGDPALADQLFAWRRRWWAADEPDGAALAAPVIAALIGAR